MKITPWQKGERIYFQRGDVKGGDWVMSEDEKNADEDIK